MRSPMILLLAGALFRRAGSRATRFESEITWGVTLGLDAFTALFDPSRTASSAWRR